VNAYEVEAGTVQFAGKTDPYLSALSVRSTIKALCKSTSFTFYLLVGK